MLQYSPDGDLMFLHTNMSPKLGLALPNDFSFYSRRWQIIQPNNIPFDTVIKLVGRDLEKEVYRILVLLRCQSWLDDYIRVLQRPDRMGPKHKMPHHLNRFHELLEGMDFRKAYRAGMNGPFAHYTELNTADWLVRLGNTYVRAIWARLIWPFRVIIRKP
jgi:hypothetical protein